MGMSGISKSQVSRLCEEIDDKVKAFLGRPIEGDWLYLWIDATYVNQSAPGRPHRLGRLDRCGRRQ
jgi:transposase-like protein